MSAILITLPSVTRLLASLSVSLVAVVGACGPDEEGAGDGRVHVAAGFARLAEVAAQVGGERVRVSDLTPPGAEPHDVELSTDDVDTVEDADLVLYLGGGFQPGLEQAARRAERAADLLVEDDGDDPHIWLDPARFAEAAVAVGAELSAVDPEGEAGYKQRAASFGAELAALDEEMEAGLATCQRRVIVTSHDAFGRLAARYGLEQEPITGISPEAEPDPRRLGELADLVRQTGVTHVFTERLVSPKVAEALAREAGVAVAVLDPLEGRLDGGYAAGMRQNLATLRTALACS